jgi:predicted  nucleic acid-binding Zn-ribbon protein
VLKRLKDILKPGKEDGLLALTSEEIPPFLDVSLKEGSITLYEKTKKQRHAVEEERKELFRLLDEISSKEREESYHPKIEKVAKNTLPLFRKAMLSALSKDLSSNPEEFYSAAGDCLRGCVKGLTGPGRYLQGVFPDEMKKIREAVDRVGRDVNAMTPAVAEARKRRDLTTNIRNNLSRFLAEYSERDSAVAGIERHREEIEKVTEELRQARKGVADLESGPEAREAAGLAEQLKISKGHLEDEERNIRADLAVVAHVLRKGEKVIQRSQGGAAAKGLEDTVDLLAGSGIPDKEHLLPALDRTLPLITSMLKSGDIALKNKEEKELFGPDFNLPARINEDFARLNRARSTVRNADHAHRQSRYQQRMKAFETEMGEATSHLETLNARIEALEERISVLDAELPAIRQSLESKLSELSGRKVTFMAPGEAGP